MLTLIAGLAVVSMVMLAYATAKGGFGTKFCTCAAVLSFLPMLLVNAWATSGAVNGNLGQVFLAGAAFLLLLPAALGSGALALGAAARAVWRRELVPLLPLVIIGLGLTAHAAWKPDGPGRRPVLSKMVQRFEEHRATFQTLASMIEEDGLAEVSRLPPAVVRSADEEDWRAWRPDAYLHDWTFKSEGVPLGSSEGSDVVRREAYVRLVSEIGVERLNRHAGSIWFQYWYHTLGALDSGAWETFVYAPAASPEGRSSVRRCLYTALGDAWYIESC